MRADNRPVSTLAKTSAAGGKQGQIDEVHAPSIPSPKDPIWPGRARPDQPRSMRKRNPGRFP
jgi:hypothetical protein